MDKAARYGAGAFLERLCAACDLPATPELIRYNTNLVYNCGTSILRLTPNSFRSRRDVLRELHWMTFVGEQTDEVVRVLGRDPNGTRQFAFEGEEFTMTRLEKIEGTAAGPDDWNAAHFERLGALVGFLHRIGQAYPEPADHDLQDWDRIPEAKLVENLPDDERDLPALNRMVNEHLATLPRLPGTYGPIHYDVHAGNYLLKADGRLVLFDFENSCRAHYLNDIAVTFYYARLHKLTCDRERFHLPFFEAFWRGYGREYSVPEQGLSTLPWFVLNRSLIVYGYVQRIWPEPRTEAEEEHFRRIERSVEDARNDLAAAER